MSLAQIRHSADPHPKILDLHRKKLAVIYVRQSSLYQVASQEIGGDLRSPIVPLPGREPVLATWIIRSKTSPFGTEKDHLPLLANTGGSVYNQTSSTASSCTNDDMLM